jgi:hypothetical protein
MRDWALLDPVIDLIEDMMEENGITHELSSSLTVEHAAHLLDTLGINVFNDDSLFDYFAGYAAAVSVMHTVLHLPDMTGLHPATAVVCETLVGCTLQNLIPLMPLLPQEAWPY